MPHQQGTFFYLHGANISPAALSARVALLQEALIAHGLEDIRLVAPPWRQNSGMVLGPVDQTLPTDEAGPGFGPNLLVNVEARLAAFNPFQVGVQGLIWRAFTNYFDDRRPELMRLIGNQLLGDSLAYQLYRPRILEYVGAELARLEPSPIVAVGESLGGVILLELLSEGRFAGVQPEPAAEEATDRPQPTDPRQSTDPPQPTDPVVVGLVTVGNQAPVLYALGALESLPYEGERPPFGPWWNVYDPRDFLSFLAEPIFRRYETRIEDVRVESGEPFPDSHGTYWELDGTWDVIRTAFGRVTEPG
jgi:hypothetical protein